MTPRTSYSFVAIWFGVTFIFGTYAATAIGASLWRFIFSPSSSRQAEQGP